MKLCFLGDAGHVNLLSWADSFHQRFGHSIDIITFNPPCEERKGITYHRLTPPFRNHKVRYLISSPTIRRLVRTLNPDLLICYRATSYGYLGMQSGFRPRIIIAQGSDLFSPKGSFFSGLLLRYVLKGADLVQAWGPHMGERLLDLGVNDHKMLICPKGVDADLFRPLPQRREDGPLMLVSTRQLRASYRHDCIFRALAQVKQKGLDFRYHVTGEGEYRSQLEALRHKLGLEQELSFLGRVDHEKLPEVLNASHIYLSMQPSDGVSASLLEAMACGVFPIVVDNAANRFWIENKVNGMLVPANDEAGLAASILYAGSHPELRHRTLEINRRRILKEASLSRNLEFMEQQYQRLHKGQPVATR